MSSKLQSRGKPATKAERAAAAVRRAIGRLVKLLDEEDEGDVYAAAIALEALGGRAVVGPLAAALSRSSSPRHRMLIVGALAAFGREEKASVIAALFAAKKRERDIQVAAVIQDALMRLLLTPPASAG
jgi:HEAT repeat protein